MIDRSAFVAFGGVGSAEWAMSEPELPLYEPHRASRRDDPPPSRLAARDAAAFARSHHALILAHLRSIRPLGGDERGHRRRHRPGSDQGRPAHGRARRRWSGRALGEVRPQRERPSRHPLAAGGGRPGRGRAAPRRRLVPMTLLALDLFCGGAAMGLYRAGFEVVGVDHRPQPRYPFAFVRADALTPPFDLADFDLVWTSPPCQRYMRSGMMARDGRHSDLIAATRRMLKGTRFVIENVPGAPMRPDLVLCGSMFGLKIRRHRWFEASGWLSPFTLACNHDEPITGVYGHPHGRGGAWRNGRRPMLPSDAATWIREMEIDWMTPAELAQAVPPAYAEFIGREVRRIIEQRAVA